MIRILARMKKNVLCVLLAFASLFCVAYRAGAQQVGIKTNVVYDATATVNLGVEVGLSQRLTLDVSGNLNLWTWRENMKWKHWLVQPALRLWTCQRFAGHFFAVHGLAGQFNFGNIQNGVKLLGTDFSVLSTRRYEGWAFGAGVGYGYALPLGKHWNLEFEAGVGAIYSRSNGFDCDVCNRVIEDEQNIGQLRPALTKAAINIVYLF